MSTPIFTVSQLNRQVRSWLEHEMGTVHVQGELSNVTQPASGHLYFTLKDTSAQIRCVYFRNRHRVSTSPQNGQQVILHGTLSLYEARGDYQLIVEQLEDAGRGDLFRQFECLKAKLAACGWFDASRKKALPLFPEVIGVITSATGAAWRDVMTTLARRYPVAKIILYASDVQGSLAAPQLIQAIAEANRDSRSDVLILARGGGSIEDLWAFNDERLAAEMINSKIPIISGVGHETDFTIADFVADHRAATPTAAAVAATPDREEIFNTLRSLENQLLSFMNRFVQHLKLLLQHELQKITSPKQLINAQWQSLDYCRGHLQHALEQLLAKKRHMLQEARAQLETQNWHKSFKSA
ncbi:MAG: exodeoxyribonuclease VII large subunit [Legionellales bacterium]|nr:exodeoxyribonuclease VII large subunit [Legionellales bacterium]